MEKSATSTGNPTSAGTKLEIAEMINRRIVSLLKTDLEKADLLTTADINSRLGEVLATQWRRSWKDGQNWKEKTWKQGNCSKAELVSNPIEHIARLEQVISEIRGATKFRG